MIITDLVAPSALPDLRSAKPLGRDRQRVFALIAIGYSILGGLVLTFLALCAKTVIDICTFNLFGYLLLGPICMLVLRLRVLWPSGSLAEGVLLTRDSAPDFYEFIDEIARRLRGPAIDVVCINADCNAAIVRRWRYGIVGRGHFCLIVGLTLMKVLTRGQFEAVIAHEIAHLASKHARMNSTVARLQLIFTRLEAALPKVSRGVVGVLRSLLKRYLTELGAAVVPLLREWEFEADRLSMELTSSRTAAQALLASQILRPYLVEAYWPSVFNAAKESGEPTASPFSQFDATAFAADSRAIARWQRAALALTTSPNDTHPCLGDRLRALGETPVFRPPESEQASDELLGRRKYDVSQTLDAAWRRRVMGSWSLLHRSTMRQRQQLQELRAAAIASTLDERRGLLHASLEERLGGGPPVSLQIRSALRKRFPESLSVQFALGRQLLHMGNSEGAAMVEAVIAKDPNALVPGADLLRHHYGDLADESLARRWQQLHGLGLAALRERRVLLLGDQVGPHQLQGAALSSVIRQLHEIPHLKSAFLVRKHIRYLPQFPVYVLGFTSSCRFQSFEQARARNVALAIRQRVALPGPLFIMNIEGENSRFATKFRRIAGARVA